MYIVMRRSSTLFALIALWLVMVWLRDIIEADVIFLSIFL